MNVNVADIPRPVTWTDYAACYKANVEEARRELEKAQARYRQFRDAGQIAAKPEGGWTVQGPTAASVVGDMVRWRSDLDHWSARYLEAKREERAAARPDPRLPPEHDPADSDAEDFAAEATP